MIVRELKQQIKELEKVLHLPNSVETKEAAKEVLTDLEKQMQAHKEKLYNTESVLHQILTFDRAKDFGFLTTLERIQIAQLRAANFDQVNYINNEIVYEKVRKFKASETLKNKIKTLNINL